VVYRFDPIYFNGTIFKLDRNAFMADGWLPYVTKVIPASFFPKSLTFVAASARLPDMFHMSRGFFIVSERARKVLEHLAPGQVEFIAVTCHADLKIAAKLKFDSAYYFINVLGNAQRMQWLNMPTRDFRKRREDGTELWGLQHDYASWNLRARAVGEPLIWRDKPWQDGIREYGGEIEVFIEDELWQELDEQFPEQLHGQRVGEGLG
jgi:hypothetical protein